MRLDAFDAGAVRALFVELRSEAETFVRSCDAGASILADYKVYMRYVGQGWEIPVPVTAALAEAPEAETFQQRFEAEYAGLFGRTVAGLSVEMTVWTVNATTPVADPILTPDTKNLTTATAKARRTIFCPMDQKYVSAQVVPRAALTDGVQIRGPAVITEDETSVVLPPGFEACGRADGCIDIQRLT